MLLSSCEDDFLEKEPYASVPIGSAITTTEEMQAAMNGVYASLRTFETFGRNIPVLGDLLADNTFIAPTNSGRYLNQNNFTLTASSAEPTEMWNNLYETILRANTVINAELPNADADVVNQLTGEAYAVRALAYHELVKFFATPYTVDPSAPGVPIVTVYEQNAEPARSSVQQVYEQIIADYAKAYDLMEAGAAEDASYMSKYAARALQARTYLFMGDYENAKAAALDVVTNSGYKLVTAANYVSYWKNPTPVSNMDETIFEVSIDAIDNNGSNALANIYDQGGYGDILATTDLYNTYTEGDVRLGVILVGERGNVKPAYIVNKYSNRTNPSDKDDIKVIRYSEVLLILAEAYARTGEEDKALEILNMLVVERGVAPYTSTGEQLIQDILVERRKELAFEGHRYWTLSRLNMPIARTDQQPASARLIPVDDPRRIQPIPQGEIDANPNVVQNDGY
ncbi:RagB/SusD family nutrient uptake outer membrane protein [Pontibacter toksunensis]|uniref:RagB/SusD family nutrient uptake outer membrane protein n=2 Tax=Pontibacter toksunensis TaxID=1332631 RepID=A0ABW6BV38_9BACT